MSIWSCFIKHITTVTDDCRKRQGTYQIIPAAFVLVNLLIYDIIIINLIIKKVLSRWIRETLLKIKLMPRF